MKLNAEHINMIDKIVDKDFFDVDVIMNYLENNEIITVDIFKKSFKGTPDKYALWCTAESLPIEKVFPDMKRELFLHRFPFFFYIGESEGEKHKYLSIQAYITNTEEGFETLCKKLEYLYYDVRLPLPIIFTYPVLQVVFSPKSVAETKAYHETLGRYAIPNKHVTHYIYPRVAFDFWVHYIQLCRGFGWLDYTPNRLITSYNYALEKAGLEPIIYTPWLNGRYFYRSDLSFVCEGHFPCDDDGKPIMRWTNIQVKDAQAITFNHEKSRYGTLTIHLSPSTTIHLVHNMPNSYLMYPDEEPYIEQIYAGPTKMDFDHEKLKARRIERNLTQLELAEAIGASVRTYQKWESGQTTPDGTNLIRLMNWLEIYDVQELIRYKEV